VKSARDALGKRRNYPSAPGARLVAQVISKLHEYVRVVGNAIDWGSSGRTVNCRFASGKYGHIRRDYKRKYLTSGFLRKNSVFRQHALEEAVVVDARACGTCDVHRGVVGNDSYVVTANYQSVKSRGAADGLEDPVKLFLESRIDDDVINCAPSWSSLHSTQSARSPSVDNRPLNQSANCGAGIPIALARVTTSTAHAAGGVRPASPCGLAPKNIPER